MDATSATIVKPKKYEIPSGPVFKFEADGDFVYIDKWFEQLGKSVKKWVDDSATKRIFARIQPLIEGPILMPQQSADEENKAAAEHRVAVNKYAVAAVLAFLKNDQLYIVVNNNMDVNTLVSVKYESLHVRTTDGWFSVSAAAKYHSFSLEEFIKSDQLKNIVNMFGDIIAAEPIKGSDDQTTIWMHPVGLIPLMLWMDPAAALELMASLYVSVPDSMPNLDIMKILIEKNTKLRANTSVKKRSDNEKGGDVANSID